MPGGSSSNLSYNSRQICVSVFMGYENEAIMGVLLLLSIGPFDCLSLNGTSESVREKIKRERSQREIHGVHFP